MIIIEQADAFHMPLTDKSVQTIVTSPPYFQLRRYLGVDGGFGQEATIAEYVQHTVQVLDECKRVLRDDGICWWNIGDSYAGSGKGHGGKNLPKDGKLNPMSGANYGMGMTTSEFTGKNLLLIPWWVAIAAQDAGWIIRDVIVWQKPNCVPESVRDRCTKSWEPILMLVKSKKYYFDAMAIKEKSLAYEKDKRADASGFVNTGAKVERNTRPIYRSSGPRKEAWDAYKAMSEPERTYPPIGGVKHQGMDIGFIEGNVIVASEFRRPRNVWTIASASTEGKKYAHVAMFPKELAKRCILCSTKPGDMVLDPFAGSGTTGVAANELGRDCTLFDISQEYVDMMKKRLCT